MKLHRIVAKDAMRRKRRTLYTSLGVAVGIAVIIAVMTVARAGEERIWRELDKYGPNIVVMPAVSDLDLQVGDLRLGSLAVGDNLISEQELPQIRRITDGAISESLDIPAGEEIAIIAPKLYMNARIKEAAVTVVGVDFGQERLLKSWWSVEDGKYPSHENEVLIGGRAGAILDLRVGDTIPLQEEKFTVSGVLGETGSNDDFYVFVPLETAQNVFGKTGLISSVDIRALCGGCPAEDIAAMINHEIPGVRAVAVKQIAETEMNMMAKLNTFLFTLGGITLLVGSFGVVNTMMASVHERIRDIGIMKAVGASRFQVAKMFLYDALVVGIVGGIFGYVAGTLLSYAIGPLLFENLSVGYALEYLPPALGLAVLVAALASAYPAYRASRISVADSLRSL